MSLKTIPAFRDDKQLVRAVAQVDRQGNFAGGTDETMSEILDQLKLIATQLSIISGTDNKEIS